MKLDWGNWFVYFLLGAAMLAVHGGRLSAERIYPVQYTDTAPIIDGMETSAGEWSSGSDLGSDWSLLTSGLPDETNNRFDAVWDVSGLYFRHQVEYDRWQNQGDAGWNLAYDHLSFYFDPNIDGEPNATDSSIDGYKLSFNQPLGESLITSVTASAGKSAEAYVNSLFGSQGGPSLAFSGFTGIVMTQQASVDDGLGYTELFIPWSDFDALHAEDRGLYHPEPPVANERWYFNMSRTAVGGGASFSLQAWESPHGAVLFSERPHGVLEFIPPFEPCDVNSDRSCDTIDIDALTGALIVGDQTEVFDTNRDGIVTVEDRMFYIEKVLNTYLGDSNLDGRFDSQDLVGVFEHGVYEDGLPGNAVWATGDWDGDLDFTSEDMVAVFIAGGYGAKLRPAWRGVAAVPEPSSLTLLVLGLLLCAKHRR